MKFVSFLCLEVEPQNCLLVKECLLNYTEALATFTGKNMEEI